MSYANYSAGVTGAAKCFTGSLVIGNTTTMTFESGLTFNISISNPATENYNWIFNCVQGANGTGVPSFPSWGFNTQQLLNLAIPSASANYNSNQNYRPAWWFTYMPLGAYDIYMNISGIGTWIAHVCVVDTVGSPGTYYPMVCITGNGQPTGGNSINTTLNGNKTMNFFLYNNQSGGTIFNPAANIVIYKKC